jgi:Protein of unknown function (DUF669)
MSAPNSVRWSDLMESAGPNTFEVISPGTYDVVVEKAEAKLASTQRQMIALTLGVEGGPYDKRRLWTNCVIVPDNPGALARFFRYMKAFGLDQGYFNREPSPDAVASTLLGRRARATVGIKKYNGEDRNEVTNITQAAAVPGMPSAVPVAAAAPRPPAAPPAAPPAPPAAPPPAAAPATAPPAAPAAAVPPPPPATPAAPPSTGTATTGSLADPPF